MWMRNVWKKELDVSTSFLYNLHYIIGMTDCFPFVIKSWQNPTGLPVGVVRYVHDKSD